MSAREGLSPRVRGNRVFGGQQRDVDGPIPARAGQPLDLSLGEGDYTAYPRACGATMLARMRRAIKAGLSPRVRGNLLRRALVLHAPGPITARAGQP